MRLYTRLFLLFAQRALTGVLGLALFFIASITLMPSDAAAFSLIISISFLTGSIGLGGSNRRILIRLSTDNQWPSLRDLSYIISANAFFLFFSTMLVASLIESIRPYALFIYLFSLQASFRTLLTDAFRGLGMDQVGSSTTFLIFYLPLVVSFGSIEFTHGQIEGSLKLILTIGFACSFCTFFALLFYLIFAARKKLVKSDIESYRSTPSQIFSPQHAVVSTLAEHFRDLSVVFLGILSISDANIILWSLGVRTLMVLTLPFAVLDFLTPRLILKVINDSAASAALRPNNYRRIATFSLFLYIFVAFTLFCLIEFIPISWAPTGINEIIMISLILSSGKLGSIVLGNGGLPHLYLQSAWTPAILMIVQTLLFCLSTAVVAHLENIIFISACFSMSIFITNFIGHIFLIRNHRINLSLVW